MTIALACLREALAKPPGVEAPTISSLFHPHVLARKHLCRWHTPYSNVFHNSILDELSLADVLQLFDVMLISIKVKMHENYGAGLLHFHQYCDSHNIAENNCMPASDHLLAAFIASWARKYWLAGLHFWHNLHGAPWYGHILLCTSTARLAKLIPSLSKCPRCPPVTLDHMHALFKGLDLLNTFDAAVFAVACVAFWSCCRLGKLVIDSENSFNPARHTTHGEGVDIIASKLNNIINPISALKHHLSVNINIPPTTPFFAYKNTSGGWTMLTCPWFLARCNQVWRNMDMLELSGHCFCIRGASELLLRGIPPDIVAMQGHWKSRAFLDYWCEIETILPLFITSSFTNAQMALVKSSMDTYARCYSK
ncbi:DNA breaking-rejoining enzyme [Suillus ampliporus]|nr:DNA breaking-rejoining enzyme [Suillus ampliporus]